MHRPPLPPGMFLVLIFTRGWDDPRAMERSEGDMSLKNPVTTPGIDPGTVRLVAQRLNHYTTPGTEYIHICIFKRFRVQGQYKFIVFSKSFRTLQSYLWLKVVRRYGCVVRSKQTAVGRTPLTSAADVITLIVTGTECGRNNFRLSTVP